MHCSHSRCFSPPGSCFSSLPPSLCCSRVVASHGTALTQSGVERLHYWRSSIALSSHQAGSTKAHSPSSPHTSAKAETVPVSSATAKLKLLEQMQQRSQGAMKELSQYASSAPRMIDARMYSASVAAQHKLSEKLSEANVYIAHLEDKVSSHNEDLQAAAEVFKKVSMEFGTTGRLADAAVAAVRFGVDQEDAIAKVKKLRSRLDALELAMKRERENFSKRVPRKVPVTWVGAASEVRLVGDFDGWTRGLDLNNPDIESDSVLRTFEAVVPLLPGKYRVKFVVDGEWRLAPEWPMEHDEQGETNNVLEVQ
ncbi:AMPK1_CBM domain-containing protein [Haematococcus lacustris]|uniref:AMPK1_CBM domain-containing protein n=1 Tax=Haematococcus lacustris TaxID=44745 RepID=A0A699ZVE1_HAELA|nr:AMPK1_CBM domain-containing protein [Haematococcus lacustris]